MSPVDIILMAALVGGSVYLLYRYFRKGAGQCASCGTQEKSACDKSASRPDR